MTTLAQLKKIANDDLTPFMEKHGFKLINTFGYLKEGPEDIYYIIYPTISHSENLKVLVACYTAEMGELIQTEFPKFVPEMVSGGLVPNEAINGGRWHIWDVGSQEQAKSSITNIKHTIEEFAFPFFDSISSRRELVGWVHPKLKSGYAKVIENILKWESK